MLGYRTSLQVYHQCNDATGKELHISGFRESYSSITNKLTLSVLYGALILLDCTFCHPGKGSGCSTISMMYQIGRDHARKYKKQATERTSVSVQIPQKVGFKEGRGNISRTATLTWALLCTHCNCGWLLFPSIKVCQEKVSRKGIEGTAHLIFIKIKRIDIYVLSVKNLFNLLDSKASLCESQSKGKKEQYLAVEMTRKYF